MITEWRFLIIQSLYHSEQRFGRREPTTNRGIGQHHYYQQQSRQGQGSHRVACFFRYFLIERSERKKYIKKESYPV